MRPTFQETFMEVAYVFAARSTCLRRKVGCVLVDGYNHVIATGYNGRPAGWSHCNEVVTGAGVTHPNACQGAFSPSGTNLEGCEAIHAEQNALLQCRDTREIYACYTTASPCLTCLKLLLGTPCQRVYYAEEYAHHDRVVELWVNKGGRCLPMLVVPSRSRLAEAPTRA